MIRVLIVDDQALVRGGFRLILESQADLEVAGEAADGVAAIAQVAELRPNVVLMDVRMPRLDGLEAARRILRRQDPPRVLMLTTFDLDEYVYAAMKAGASGFLLKDVRPEQLVDAVHVVMAGTRCSPRPSPAAWSRTSSAARRRARRRRWSCPASRSGRWRC